MVYNGPSKGCKACRKRRVRCDQGKPACGNCSKRKVDCPGYESTFDYRHRNQTDSTILRAQQTTKRKTSFAEPLIAESLFDESSDYSSSSYSPSSTDLAVMMAQAGSPNVNEFVIPAPADHLSPDPESVVLNWYFTNYPMKCIDPQSSHGFVALLKPLYLSSPVDSPLRPAVAAVASNLLMLFADQGCDTDLARKFYAKSITRMQTLIGDPARSKQDDILLTTMTLNFYDNINLRWNPDNTNFNNHRNGALALLKHRGAANNQNDVSRGITACMRTAVCHWALDAGTGVSPDVLEWLIESSVPTNKASELDVISLKLVEYQDRFNNVFNLYKSETLDVDQSVVKNLIEDGQAVDKLFSDWSATCPSHWRPLFAAAADVLPSIRNAGFYGEKCSVYWDLSICDIWNTYRIRRLILLRMIRQLCIDSLGSQFDDILANIDTIMYQMVDEMLECLPFMLGDLTKSMPHECLYLINYPSASNGICNYPNPDHDHHRSAAASGGWLCATVLMSAAKLAVRNKHLDPVMLRKDQFDWILEQLGRMQTVFLLSQPTQKARWKAFKQF